MRLQQRSTTRTFYRSSQTVKNMPELTTLRCDKLMMLALRGFERRARGARLSVGGVESEHPGTLTTSPLNFVVLRRLMNCCFSRWGAWGCYTTGLTSG
jgi:hypothetical protein